MAKMKWKGLAEWELQLSRLYGQSEEMAKKAVYEGAKVMADAIRTEIDALPIDNSYNNDSTHMRYGITPQQKAGLQEGFGIAPAQNDGGYINVKLGFDGYNAVKTKQFPNGQPNSMIARSVNAGTSFRQAIPFVDRTIRAYKDKTEQAIQEKLEEEIQKITK